MRSTRDAPFKSYERNNLGVRMFVTVAPMLLLMRKGPPFFSAAVILRHVSTFPPRRPSRVAILTLLAQVIEGEKFISLGSTLPT